MGKKIVHIKVGPELVDFGIHENLPCHYSKYFRGAFKTLFQEAKTGEMSFPETSADVFELFGHWIYYQTLLDLEPDLDLLLDLYVFAEMTRIPSLMNLVLVDLEKTSVIQDKLPTATKISQVWDNVWALSPLRRFIVDWLVWNVTDEGMEKGYSVYPDDLKYAVMKAQRDLIHKFIDGEEPENPKEDMSCYDIPDNK